MRVLLLYPRTLDAASSMGGVAEFLCALAPRLKALGVEPIIYAGDKSLRCLTKPKEVLTDATVYNGPFIKPGLFITKRKLSPALSVCNAENIDLIHAQGTYTAGFMALQLSKHTDIPYVVTSHSDILAANSKRIRRKNVQRRCAKVLRYAAAVTHLTPMMEAVSHQLFDTREKSTIIGNGIDARSWTAYAELPECDYILGMGRLERGKGFHILIAMYAELIKRGIKTPLVIAGKGSEEQALFSLAEQYGTNVLTGPIDLSRLPAKTVVFPGYVRDAAKKRLIAQSKLVLFPTQPDLWEEAFGIVQLEAMAAGKPIIASDTQATRYLQDSGLEASIIAPADVMAWAEATYALLQAPLLRKSMGGHNLKMAAKFDWQPIAKQYEEIFRKHLKTSKKI